MIPFPDKKYKVIYADPPWKYDHGSVPQGGVDYQYNTMTLEEIKALPIPSITDDPAVLLLWATFPLLKEAMEVIEAWGFEYKTLGFSWIKQNKSGIGYFFGIGYYAKSNVEVCLLGTKGQAGGLVKNNDVSSLIIAPLDKHSRKPQEARRRIERLFGDVPRIELFARQKAWGWDSWGNQVPDDVQPLPFTL